MKKQKLQSINSFEKMKPEQTNRVFGGTCTSVYTNTKVPTNGSTDSTINPNDWDHFANDGGGCPPTDTTKSSSTGSVRVGIAK